MNESPTPLADAYSAAAHVIAQDCLRGERPTREHLIAYELAANDYESMCEVSQHGCVQ